MKLTELQLIATTVGNNEKFYPAVRGLVEIHYWHNVTCNSEMAAYKFAQAKINDALEAANKVVEGWNVINL